MQSAQSFEIDDLKRVLEEVQERLRIAESKEARLEEKCQELEKDVATLCEQIKELQTTGEASDGIAASSSANRADDRKAISEWTPGFLFFLVYTCDFCPFLQKKFFIIKCFWVSLLLRVGV